VSARAATSCVRRPCLRLALLLPAPARPPRTWRHLACPRAAGDRCDGCSGNQLVTEKKTFEVHVEQGMRNGQKITLRGEAGCSEAGLQPGEQQAGRPAGAPARAALRDRHGRAAPRTRCCTPRGCACSLHGTFLPPPPHTRALSPSRWVVVARAGDVVLVVQQKEHGTFQRLNNNHVDLLHRKHISLADALCGCTLHLQHLDGRMLKVGAPWARLLAWLQARWARGNQGGCVHAASRRGSLAWRACLLAAAGA